MLKPWRDVVTPHPDVAKGKYQQAEFAADLSQVVEGKAEPEYQDPTEFFARTYLTEGMRRLLITTLERLTRKGGEPVVQLKTAFGGGKTHTMLTLYHMLLSRKKRNKPVGLTEILKETELAQIPDTSMAVIVGTSMNPSTTREVNGIKVHTLWGDMAAQLGGADAYALIENADRQGVSPGANDLLQIFERFGPSLILIDELVAYARNIYGVSGLPAGSFDSNLTFVQSLTEAVRRSSGSIVVASIPASDIEIGGEGGRAALERIENTFGRMESIWKPVGTMEGFEIVRRRLFSPVKDEEARDEMCREFARLYDENSSDFPPQCLDARYLDRLRSAYPIHPELFDRLYDDWSSLERFQRTRGVLRLMAAVIYELWMRQDQSYLILPGSIPLDAPRVKNELLRYLPEGWNAVIEKDVDGERSEPRLVDMGNMRFSQCAAARKVARTIFLGSAPHVRAQGVRGIEDVRVLLGVMQPGETVALYNDATAKLAEKLTYMYAGNSRYWYDTQPNLRRTMEERAVKLDKDEVELEILRRLRQIRERGDFKAVHVGIQSSDIPDDQDARLVVLAPSSGYRAHNLESPAIKAASEILDKRGNAPRSYRNMLLFIAADAEHTGPLEQETRRHLAWKSIVEDADTLNLDAHQRKESKSGMEKSDTLVNTRTNDTYCWLLSPIQQSRQVGEDTWEVETATWEMTRIMGSQENPIIKAAKKVKSDQRVIIHWSPELLRMELDRWLWRESAHVGVKRVWECLATYLYLPRLRDREVFIEAIKEGLADREFFAYALSAGVDGKYKGLVFNKSAQSVFIDEQSVLVKPEAAIKQLEEEAALVSVIAGSSVTGGGTALSPTNPSRPKIIDRPQPEPGDDRLPPVEHRSSQPKRFHGSVKLDPARLSRDAGKIAQEVLQHLTSLMKAEAEVTLEINVRAPEGVNDQVVRTVTENCRTLKFTHHGFEEE